MIIDAIITILTSIISGLISILPNAEILPEGFNNAWAWFANFINNFFYTIPLGEEILEIISWIIVFEIAFFTWKIFNWAINHN